MMCTVAALQQAEKGALELDAPVDTCRTEFADLGVLEGFDDDTPKIRPGGGRATVRQLITQTSGPAYWFLNEDLQEVGGNHRRPERHPGDPVLGDGGPGVHQPDR